MALGFGVPVALAVPKGDSNLTRHDGGPRRGRCAMQHSSECCIFEVRSAIGGARCVRVIGIWFAQAMVSVRW